MDRVYEKYEFLSLDQVLDHIKLLFDIDLPMDMMIQLINEKKISCYADVIGLVGVVDSLDHPHCMATTICREFSLLYDALLTYHPASGFYELSGILSGSVTIKGECDAQNVLWRLSAKQQAMKFMRLNKVSSFIPLTTQDIYIKPADVKQFFSSESPGKPIASASLENPRLSALLMIAYFRDLLCHPSSDDKKIIKRATNQTALMIEIEERFGVSQSTQQKLFAEATSAAKDKN